MRHSTDTKSSVVFLEMEPETYCSSVHIMFSRPRRKARSFARWFWDWNAVNKWGEETKAKEPFNRTQTYQVARVWFLNFEVVTSFSFLSFSVTDVTKVGKVMYWKSTEKINSEDRFRQRASLSSMTPASTSSVIAETKRCTSCSSSIGYRCDPTWYLPSHFYWMESVIGNLIKLSGLDTRLKFMKYSQIQPDVQVHISALKCVWSQNY